MEEDNLNFFTERTTSLIYEAMFYDDFVLVRPVTPLLSSAIRQLTWNEFNAEFEESWVDRTRLRAQLDGIDPDEKKDVEI